MMRMLLKLTLVELKLFVREPITMVFTFALPLIFLFVLGGVFKNTPDPDVYRGVGAMNYYTPAYIGLVIASIAVVGCRCISLATVSEACCVACALRRFLSGLSSVPRC